MIPEFIRCEFEESENFCHWQVKHSEVSPNFNWTRQTGESIAILEIPGPAFDHDEKKDMFFVFVSASQALEPMAFNQPDQYSQESGATIMASPFLISQEHPEECLEFWFYLEVLAKLIYTATKNTVGAKQYGLKPKMQSWYLIIYCPK